MAIDSDAVELSILNRQSDSVGSSLLPGAEAAGSDATAAVAPPAAARGSGEPAWTTGGHGHIAECSSAHAFRTDTASDLNSPVAYMGNNRVLFHKLILGPDLSLCTCSLVLIVVPAVAFFVVIAPEIEAVLTILAAVMIGFSVGFLFKVSTVDPGIIPRNETPPQESEMTLQIMRDVNGVLLAHRYCRTCFVFRGPRASHCSVCDNCVERFDHHCPWTGTCIGLHNYRFFVGFLVSVNVTAVLFAVVSGVAWVDCFRRNDEEGFGAFFKAPEELFYVPLILIVYSLVVALCTCPLTAFHFYLIATAQTTREFYKRYSKDESNPFDLGFRRNLWNFLRAVDEIRPPAHLTALSV
eukprot:NODE_930_length_1813_cov_54.234127_g818_i0.p1 GENE.NODE_930_length_1813_cov_54.234127_g818_i0~~NODE_930_length_1813_cov_54.234127_g818_i0.p1  ORF type:complete len:353 (-),score=29.88 NODE_930_length_1813_cov_54.234127_g818_i0:288-1346(-)